MRRCDRRLSGCGPNHPIPTTAPARVRCFAMGPKKAAAVSAMLVLAGWAASAGVAGADPTAPPPEPKTTMDHDGTYLVGTDILPGTYSSAGPVENGTCYWKRLSDVEHNDIIDNAMTSKPQVVQIEPGDKAFKTHDCQPWHKTDGAVPPAPAPPPVAEGALGILNGIAGRAGAGQPPGP